MKSAAGQSANQFLGRDRKLGDPNSRSIIDGIGYRRRNDADPGFADCLSGKRARTDCGSYERGDKRGDVSHTTNL